MVIIPTIFSISSPLLFFLAMGNHQDSLHSAWCMAAIIVQPLNNDNYWRAIILHYSPLLVYSELSVCTLYSYNIILF